MSASQLSDEPLIRPFSTGSALVRLIEVEAALRAINSPEALPSYVADLRHAREAVIDALQRADRSAIAIALQSAQMRLAALHNEMCASESQQPAVWAALGFPMPKAALSAVDVSTVVVTYAKPKKQVTTSIAFDDAAGATGYWLHEITDLPGDEEVQDGLLSSKTPLFPRVRLPIGRHRLLIESRNADEHIESQEFVIEVPDL